MDLVGKSLNEEEVKAQLAELWQKRVSLVNELNKMKHLLDSSDVNLKLIQGVVQQYERMLK
eukprot:CAMPEP_0116889940 /NCGR_PEP_ID=MMETSP0467-20121206/501_1 /TAXON_ID=283647 /ORGANISM="Mesodinium pulex, Strain SPMC105" /LENGTH=60 /DNA_ID=CAMNT_0004557247 /DNA_START=184 /DNA_END=366 /DNA_ORIENTATION=+